jgi:hypothetical protein
MTTISTINLFMALLLISATNGGCTPVVTTNPVTNAPREQSTPAPNASTTATPGIRSVDFANFTYPGQYILPGTPKNLTLERGSFERDEIQIKLAYLDFGDVTGDGVEDAMAVLAPVLTGSATPLVTYIYILKDNRPKLIWAFSSGDRADGGLRRAYAESGQLVVELFSRINSKGACCPSQFTRTTYAWDGASFKQHGAVETIPNSTGSSDTLMSEYKSTKR